MIRAETGSYAPAFALAGAMAVVAAAVFVIGLLRPQQQEPLPAS